MTKNKIVALCKQYSIKNYTINEDESIDVDDDVAIQLTKLNKLPLNFNRVSGDFYCDFNALTTLEGCPRYVNNILQLKLMVSYSMTLIMGKYGILQSMQY
jgi:hypothetical protein